jgi:dTMP kinase
VTRGRFITLEGCEGAGKSTNVAIVQMVVQRAGHDTLVTREPGGTPLAEQIRDLLRAVRDEPVATSAELLLVFAARAQHLERTIMPALARGPWVICDRFTDATYAYQGGGRGMDARVIQTLEQLVQDGLQPDLTLYFDLSLEEARARIANRDHDRFEREGAVFFDAVRAVYLERAARLPRYRTIAAGESVAQVGERVADLVGRFTETVQP